MLCYDYYMYTFIPICFFITKKPLIKRTFLISAYKGVFLQMIGVFYTLFGQDIIRIAVTKFTNYLLSFFLLNQPNKPANPKNPMPVLTALSTSVPVWGKCFVDLAVLLTCADVFAVPVCITFGPPVIGKCDVLLWVGVLDVLIDVLADSLNDSYTATLFPSQNTLSYNTF